MEAETLFQQANDLVTRNALNEALPLYKQLVANSADPRFYISYARCLQLLRHWAESIPMFEKGIDLKPHYGESDARLMLAESYLNNDQKSKAILEWRIVAKMQPEYPSYEQPINEAQALLLKHA